MPVEEVEVRAEEVEDEETQAERLPSHREIILQNKVVIDIPHR